MQYFTQYHYDGVKRTYLKYQYTQADKDRMTGDSTESATVGSVTKLERGSKFSCNTKFNYFYNQYISVFKQR